MNTVAEDYIWRAILESERSDDIQYMDDELRIKREAIRVALLQRRLAATPSGEAAVKAALSPVPA